MKQVKRYIVYLLMLLNWACSSNSISDGQIFLVDPSEFSDNSFDDFYRLKEVITLETTDSSSMTELIKVVGIKDRIFILTYGRDNIYCFGRDGKFIRKLERQGRGPGEYQTIGDFVVTQNPDQIIIYDFLGKLVYYTWEGDFLREEKLDSYISHFEHLPNGNWFIEHATWPTSTINDTAYILQIANADGKYFKGSIVLPKLLSPMPTMPSTLYKGKEYIYSIPITENTIYKYDYLQDSFDPVYTFLMKNHAIPSSLDQNDRKKPIFYNYYVFNCEYIGNKTICLNAYCLAEMNLLTLIGDKKSGIAHVFPEIFEDRENELTLNRYIQHTGFDGDIVVFTRPLQMLERKFKNNNSVGSQLSAKLTEQDNPVLLIYEEK